MYRLLVYGMIYLGSALMAYNIYGFITFIRSVRKRRSWSGKDRALFIPVFLLIVFLLGYLTVAFFGKPDLVVASILFGGSIFVFVMYRMLSSIMGRVLENEEIEARLLAAEETNRAKNEFLASISHEMRTPINVIQGLNTLALNNPDLPNETRGQLMKIDDSARQLAALINNILDLQQTESGELTVSQESFSLKELLVQIDSITAAACKEKGLRYIPSFAACTAQDYTGDAIQLKRALLCILENAVKYTDAPGTVSFTVNYSEGDEGNTEIHFVVQDTGVGIDEAFLPRIFDSLTQEDASFTNRFGGSGIGLAVAKRIIDQMGGTIKADSTKGAGSTFTITVPLMPQSEARSEKETDPCGDSHADGEETKLEGRRILVAEDMPINAEIVANLLELEGAESELAENGLAAVNMVQQSDEYYYDAILMDLRMPIMDGLEATRQIRSLERKDARTIPIIALTANAFESDVQASLAAGMNAHLAKPTDAGKLYDTLKYWIAAATEPGRQTAP